MANVFGILTAIVLALASFVAYRNKTATETEISNTGSDTDKAAGIAVGTKAEPIGKVAKNAKQDGPNAKAELGYQLGRLELANNNLAATIAKRTGVDAEVVKQNELKAAQEKSNEALTQENATKTAKIEPNKAKLDAIREKTSKVGDLKELASKMSKMKVELEETNQAISTAEAKLANITALNNQSEGQISTAKVKFERYISGQSLATLNTRIRAIYPSWGFVTLAVGNNAGVVANSTLEVVRDGATIAKLLVTSVETGSASASIVPDSVAQNVTLMVGDRVIPMTKAAAPVKPVAAPKAVAKPKPATPAAPVDPAATPADPAAPVDPAAAPVDPAAAPVDPAATPAAPADPAAAPAAPAAPADPAAAPAAGTL